jgi:hypothetical protein
VTLKGRHWVALWLAGFLLVAVSVVWRQTEALRTATALRALQDTVGALETGKAAAMADVRRARSRDVLVPLAWQRLGLRPAQDSEIVILQRPDGR